MLTSYGPKKLREFDSPALGQFYTKVGLMYFSQRLASPKPTVILGDGPSLKDTDLGLLRDGNAKVLCINYSIRRFPAADVFYYHHEEKVEEMIGSVDVLGRFLTGELQVYSSSFVSKHAGRPWPVVPFSGRTGFELDPRLGIRTGGNSGAAAINLAYHMGARKIVLVGVDCCEAENGEFNWWKTPRDPSRLKYDYPDWIRKFELLAAELPGTGLEVVNASVRTALKTFPQVTLAEALLGDTRMGGRSLENS